MFQGRSTWEVELDIIGTNVKVVLLPVEGWPVGTIPEALAVVQVRIEPAVVVPGDGFVYFDIHLNLYVLSNIDILFILISIFLSWQIYDIPCTQIQKGTKSAT